MVLYRESTDSFLLRIKAFRFDMLYVRCPFLGRGRVWHAKHVSRTSLEAVSRCPRVRASSLKAGSIPRHSGHLKALLSQLPARKSAIKYASVSVIGSSG